MTESHRCRLRHRRIGTRRRNCTSNEAGLGRHASVPWRRSPVRGSRSRVHAAPDYLLAGPLGRRYAGQGSALRLGRTLVNKGSPGIRFGVSAMSGFSGIGAARLPTVARRNQSDFAGESRARSGVAPLGGRCLVMCSSSGRESPRSAALGTSIRCRNHWGLWQWKPFGTTKILGTTGRSRLTARSPLVKGYGSSLRDGTHSRSNYHQEVVAGPLRRIRARRSGRTARTSRRARSPRCRHRPVASSAS